MAYAPEKVAGLAETMIEAQERALMRERGSLGKIRRYLKGHHDLPYMPYGAKLEFRELARKSITNWLPLVVDTYAKGLFVDGYRPGKSPDNANAWEYWQKNRLDARQTIAHRGALEYGAGYVLVLPGTDGPVIKPISPTRVWAVYEDEDDEWPVAALIRKGKTIEGEPLYEFLDDAAVYTLIIPKGSGKPVIRATEYHDLQVCPIVRFRDRLDGENVGIIRPLIRIQDRVNEAVFALMVALQYASFRQRWATGMAVPMKDIKDPKTGEVIGEEPIEPFESAVNRLWMTDNPDARFGDFAQTEVQGHLSTYESTVRTLAAIAQTPPHVLLGDLINLSADALAAAEAGTQRKIGEYETIFGESWEQVLRLAALADGDTVGAMDESSQVRWRDTEARALASTVDALGKMAQMLQVPVEGLWERIPGVTKTDLDLWRELAARGDGITALANALSANVEATSTAASFAPAPAPPPPAPGSPNP
jgi:hypothetical protein